MPTYEYRCPTGHTFEVFQKMSDDPVAECPQCGADAERLISGGAGFLFKGEGFYITDHRSADYKQKVSKETPSEGGAAGDSSGSSDSSGGSSKTDAKPVSDE
jgi:putative FmdB family regulatory protein